VVDLDLDAFEEWISIPPEELPSRSPIPIEILPTPDDVFRHFAESVFTEIAETSMSSQNLNLVVPIGPRDQFPILADRINSAGQSLEHVTFFGMDEWLDWQGRPVPWGHPNRLEAYFHRHFVDLVDPDLRPPKENVIFPSPLAIDNAASEITRRGGIGTTYAGFGFQGHIAFNEPPGNRWSPVTLDDLRASTTRIVQVQTDSIIAHAQRSLGGNVFRIPPMAITLGMRELLSAKRVRLYAVTGSWKQTILRILLFSDPTVDYPVTLVHGHRDVAVVVDARTAECPPTDW
jgi:glucosamine-6-phosphate deaminase